MSPRRSFLYPFLALIAIVVVIVPVLTFAASSTNFDLNQERGGPVEYSATTTNYEFKAEIGHPGVGQSTSTNYVYDHGTFWFGVNVTVKWAVPELRVGATSTNDDSVFYLTLRTPSNTDNTILETMSMLATTSVDGTYLSHIQLGSAAGTYDVGIKTNQHLTSLIQDVSLISGNNELNFTNVTNSVGVYGSRRLSAGDVSGAGTSVSTLGDDVVNSIDLSILIPELDTADATGNAIRSNLNQDIVVNSVDLSIMLQHLDQYGEQ